MKAAAQQQGSLPQRDIADYEEVAFAPSASDVSHSGPTYKTQSGTYVKVGRKVSFCRAFSWQGAAIHG